MRLLILRQGPWAAGPSGYGALPGLGGGRQASPVATEAPAGKELPWEPAAATSWMGHPALSSRGEGPQAVSVVAVMAAALLLSLRLGVAPTAK